MAIDPFLRRQIMGLSEAALRAADVVDVLPTPLDQVARVAGIAEVVNIGNLPDELVAARPKGLRQILGAYLYRAETAFVDLSQPLGRQRFIIGHETGHKIIPWHAQAFHLDDEKRIFLDANEELEEEANLAASLLLFQGGRFHARALDYETSLQAPVSLAGQYGASFHASIRFYAEHHPEPVALIVAGRLPRSDRTVPILLSVESTAFAERFGSFRSLMPVRGVPLGPDAAQPIGALALAAYNSSEVASERMKLTDLAGNAVTCNIETFDNQHCLFIMASTRTLLRRGRRIIVHAS
jgi:IrrE N-terminal-like domain